MAPGGSIFDCDDCAWQVCFKATECLRAYAAERGLQPEEVLDQVPPLMLARHLTPAELEELAAEIEADRRPLIVVKPASCLSPEGVVVLQEQLVAAIRDRTQIIPAGADV